MYNQISLKTILEGRIFNQNSKEWENIDEPQQQEYLLMFKEWLMSKCRYDSNPYNRIKWASLSQVKKNNCGLFNRLVIEKRDNNPLKVTYICGQSWSDEIRTLKNQFIK